MSAPQGALWKTCHVPGASSALSHDRRSFSRRVFFEKRAFWCPARVYAASNLGTVPVRPDPDCLESVSVTEPCPAAPTSPSRSLCTPWRVLASPPRRSPPTTTPLPLRRDRTQSPRALRPPFFTRSV